MLSAKEAFRRTQELVTRKESTMMDVLRDCNKAIEKHIKRKHTSCVYLVPEFMWCAPVYDVNACINFVKERLSDEGFCVMYLFPRYLVISWDLPAIASMPQAVHKLIAPRRAPAVARAVPPPKFLTDGSDVRGTPVAAPDRPSVDHTETKQQGAVREEEALKSLFIRSISDLKPSGRLVLDLT